jgi:hypothetical protein
MTRSAASPQDGDLVIARDSDGQNGYTLSTVPSTPQLRYATYEHAVAAATEWALRERVAIWFTEDGKTFTALEPGR